MSAAPYMDFLAAKEPRAIERGFSQTPTLSSALFPFQRHCVELHSAIHGPFYGQPEGSEPVGHAFTYIAADTTEASRGE